MATESISEPLDFMPQTLLVVRAFGTQNMPHLVLKSGYCPDNTTLQQAVWNFCEILIISVVLLDLSLDLILYGTWSKWRDILSFDHAPFKSKLT